MLGEELGLQSPVHNVQAPAPPVQDSCYLSAKSGASGEPGDELDLSFLPDELSTQDEQSHGNSGMTSTDGGSAQT